MLGYFLPGRYLMMSTDHGFARHGKVRSHIDFCLFNYTFSGCACSLHIFHTVQLQKLEHC